MEFAKLALPKAQQSKTSTTTNVPIILVQYFKKLFKYAVDRHFITRQQAKKVSNYELSKSGETIGSKIPKRFCSFMKSFLSIPFLTSRTWVEIFYTRMVMEQTKLSLCHVYSIVQLIYTFIKEYPTEAHTGAIPSSINKIFNFLESHQLDPDNCLLGLKVSPKYRKLFNEHIKNKQKHFPSSLKLSLIEEKFKIWNEESNKEALADDVKDFILQIYKNSQKDIKIGDLVLIKTSDSQCPIRISIIENEILHYRQFSPNATINELEELLNQSKINENALKLNKSEDRIVVGRIGSIDLTSGNVEVYVDPIEKSTVNVKLEEIMSFNDEMIKTVQHEKISILREIIEDDQDEIYTTLSMITNKLIGEYLQKNHDISLDILKNILDKKFLTNHDVDSPFGISFVYYKEIQKYMESFRVISLGNLKNAIDIQLKPLREKLLIESPKLFIFHPNRTEFTEKYLTIHENLCEKIISNANEEILSLWEDISIEMKQYKNGTKKLLLSEIWSNLVNQRTIEVLKLYDFNFEIPQGKGNTQIRQTNIQILKKLIELSKNEFHETFCSPILQIFLPFLESFSIQLQQIINLKLDHHYNEKINSNHDDKFSIKTIEDSLNHIFGFSNISSDNNKFSSEPFVNQSIFDLIYVHIFCLQVCDHKNENFDENVQIVLDKLHSKKQELFPYQTPSVYDMIINYLKQQEEELDNLTKHKEGRFRRKNSKSRFGDFHIIELNKRKLFCNEIIYSKQELAKLTVLEIDKFRRLQAIPLFIDISDNDCIIIDSDYSSDDSECSLSMEDFVLLLSPSRRSLTENSDSSSDSCSVDDLPIPISNDQKPNDNNIAPAFRKVDTNIRIIVSSDGDDNISLPLLYSPPKVEEEQKSEQLDDHITRSLSEENLAFYVPSFEKSTTSSLDFYCHFSESELSVEISHDDTHSCFVIFT